MSNQAYPESRLRGLKPWQPGQSGNTKGRKKGLTTLIREALERDELMGQKTPDGRSIAEHYVESIIAHGMKGNAPYMMQLMDRIEGKVGVETASEEQRKAQTPVVELPIKDLHPSVEVQTPAGSADGIPGE